MDSFGMTGFTFGLMGFVFGVVALRRVDKLEKNRLAVISMKLIQKK